MLLNIPKWPHVKPNITDTYFKMSRNKILLPIKQKRNQTRPDHCIYHRSTWYRLCKRRIQKQLGLVFDFSMTGLNCFGLCEILSKDENPVFHKISQFLDYMYFVSTLIFDIHLNIHLVTIMPFSLLFFFLLLIKIFWFGLLLFDQLMVSPKSSSVQGCFLFTVLLFWTQVFIAGFEWIFICSPNISCDFCV